MIVTKVFFIILLIVQAYTAKEYKLVWAPEANKEGLKAFEGVEDESGQVHKVTHIMVEGNNYRFNIHKQDRDTDHKKQRQEVKGMVVNGKNVRMEKGETWKFTYSMFIPSSLMATTSFTHLSQMKVPKSEHGSPLYVMSLRRRGDNETIEAQVFTGGNRLGSAPLKPLKNKWTDVVLEYFVHDTQGSVNWTLISDNKVVINAHIKDVLTYMPEDVRPKWGIYRSLEDTNNILDTYLLITKMRAYKLQ